MFSKEAGEKIIGKKSDLKTQKTKESQEALQQTRISQT